MSDESHPHVGDAQTGEDVAGEWSIRGTFDRCLATISAALLAGISITILVQVTMRYGFRSPLTWADELTRLQLVWLTFIGAALTYRLRADIAVDAVTLFARRRGWDHLADSITGLIGLAVALVATALLIGGIQLVQATMARPTPALDVPMATFYIVIPIFASIVLLSTVARLYSHVRNRGND